MTKPIEIIGGELDALDDAIAARLQQLAEVLRTRVTVRIQVKVDEDRDLAFGKCHGKWGFIICDAGGDAMLVTRSRDERLEMVEDGHLERLISDAEKQLSEMVPSRRAAVAKLDDLINLARS